MEKIYEVASQNERYGNIPEEILSKTALSISEKIEAITIAKKIEDFINTTREDDQYA